MKKTLVKAILLGTMALSLLVAGVSAVNTADTYVAACHDGLHDEMVEK